MGARHIDTVINEVRILYDKIKDDPTFEGIAEKDMTPVATLLLAQATANLCNCLNEVDNTMKLLLKRIESKSYFQNGKDGDGI